MAGESPVRNPYPWAALVALPLCAVAAWLISLGSQLRFGIEIPPGAQLLCKAVGESPYVAVRLFNAEVEWRAAFLLEAVVAAFGCILAAAALRESWSAGRRFSRFILAGLIFEGALLLGKDLSLIGDMVPSAACSTESQKPDSRPLGFLPRLAEPLACAKEKCGPALQAVTWGRLAGEPAGFALGIALFATATLPRSTTRKELARRNRRLNLLLYAVSFLFVAGILMCRANFSWLLAQGSWLGSEPGKEVIDKGVKLAGVVYSAILAIFYLPARWILGRAIEASIPEGQDVPGTEAREKWLKENGFTAGWKGDTKQILAVLAPVLSAPIFDVLAK